MRHVWWKNPYVCVGVKIQPWSTPQYPKTLWKNNSLILVSVIEVWIIKLLPDMSSNVSYTDRGLDTLMSVSVVLTTTLPYYSCIFNKCNLQIFSFRDKRGWDIMYSLRWLFLWNRWYLSLWRICQRSSKLLSHVRATAPRLNTSCTFSSDIKCDLLQPWSECYWYLHTEIITTNYDFFFFAQRG